MAKVFEKLKDLVNPNRKADRIRKEQEAARLAEEQEFAMRMAAEEAEKLRKKATNENGAANKKD